MNGIITQDEGGLDKLSKKASILLEQFVKFGLSIRSFLHSSVFRTFLKILVYCCIVILLCFVVVILPPILQHSIGPVSRINQDNDFLTVHPAQPEIQKRLEKELVQLDKKITSLTPRSYYLIINSAENEFFLYRGKNFVQKGRCSTGSYILLQNGDKQKWLFKTPRGEFSVMNKRMYPVWKKPDWAFIESGLPVPSVNHSSRFEYGVLGDYALSLGDGYLIHGTLYQRFLGLPVTHGCVRLNDKDLELIYRTLKVGSKVFIY